MDAGLAERLAGSVDPKALSALQNRNDPAVARAVAAQFGSFLMQGMMQGADGTALPVAGDGTGSPAVNAMFASTMGRYAMSGDKLGLANTIYQSMTAKGGPAAASQTEGTDNAPADTATAPAKSGSAKSGGGISLAPYWQDRGMRPVGGPMGRMNQPTGFHAASDKASRAPSSTKAAVKTPAAPAAPMVQADQAPVMSVAAAPPVAAPSQVMRARWTGMDLPQQAHVLLPPAEPDSPAAVTTASPNIAVGAFAATTRSTAGAPLPYGMPWTHGTRGTNGAETGTPNQHHASAPGGTPASLAEAQNFAEELAPAIHDAAARLGVSPRVLLAQAALETGWGHSVVGNNVFGVKAGSTWTGATVNAGTHEMENGHLVAHRANFRSYANLEQSVNDYASLVSASDRYRAAVGAGDNVAAYAQALAAGGYASDRDYAAKLMAVANSPKMAYAVASLDDNEPGQLVSAHG